MTTPMNPGPHGNSISLEFVSCCMTVVGLCLLSCVGKPDRVKTTEGVVQEPEEFLRSVHLLHGGIAARPTGTDKSRRTRTEIDFNFRPRF